MPKGKEGKHEVEEAYRNRSGFQSREQVASNMVAWFSQRITVGQSKWSDHFERKRIEGSWSYRPVEGV